MSVSPTGHDQAMEGKEVQINISKTSSKILSADSIQA